MDMIGNGYHYVQYHYKFYTTVVVLNNVPTCYPEQVLYHTKIFSLFFLTPQPGCPKSVTCRRVGQANDEAI